MLVTNTLLFCLNFNSPLKLTTNNDRIGTKTIFGKERKRVEKLVRVLFGGEMNKITKNLIQT